MNHRAGDPIRQAARPRYVYALLDPLTLRPRYVGITLNPTKRLAQHCAPRSPGGARLRAWVLQTLALGSRPKIVVLEKVLPPYGRREHYWMSALRRDGHVLLNSQDACPLERCR